MSKHFKKKNIRIVSLAVLALTLAATLLACTKSSYNMHQAVQAQRFAPENPPMLLAVVQPWFGEKEHIDVGYNSTDPKVAQRQIAQAKELGIGGFVVNWYGPRKQFMDRAYEVMQREAVKQGFKIAMQYDEAVDNPGNWTDAVIVDLQYAYDKYIAGHDGVPTGAYLRHNGRPVIFIFPKTPHTDWNRVREVTQTWPDPPLLIYKDPSEKYPNAFDGYYAWVQPGKQGWRADGSNWGQTYLENFYTRMRTKYPDKIAVGAAWPGFDDRPASWSQNRIMNARCGKTFDESLRMFRRFYQDTPLPYLLIVTWNDYEEGTAIERGLMKCGPDGQQKETAWTKAKGNGAAK